MSEEHIEIVRKVHATVNARDVDAFVRCWDRDCSYRPGLEGAMEGQGTVYQGHERLRRWWQEMDEAWAAWTTEIGAIRDLGDTLIVDCVVRLQARAGMAFEASFVQVVTIRNGLIVRSDDYLNRAAGLKAAGLVEE
jgi:ketosteroid isomerase-like protein